MHKPCILALLLSLAACSGVPHAPDTTSPCYEAEASYACQIERYNNVNY